MCLCCPQLFEAYASVLACVAELKRRCSASEIAGRVLVLPASGRLSELLCVSLVCIVSTSSKFTSLCLHVSRTVL